MARENQTTTPDRPGSGSTLPPGGAAAPVARTETRAVPAASERARPAGRRAPGGAAGNGRSGDPAELRREIERTRARMSSTLDAIEARIVHERESLERKADELVDRATLRPLRERLGREPWRSIAIGFVVGYVVAAIRD